MVPMGMPSIDVNGRFLTGPISKVFGHFSNIESYTEKYPHYYGKIDLMSRVNEKSITTREFLNISLDAERNHVVVHVQYKLIPMKEISYEVIGDYGNGIKNKITFQAMGRLTYVIGTIVPLDIISLPPGSKESKQYIRMLNYFRSQDIICLQNKPLGNKIGEICTGGE
jgi:hypothetical protein